MPTTLLMGSARTAEPEAPRDASQKPRGQRCPSCKQTFSGESRFCPFDGDPLVEALDYNPTTDPLIGTTIDGRYEVMSVLGEGGMGTVYEVRHAALGRRFAVKVLRRDIADRELGQRFIQEAKAAAAVGHPNIVTVSDFGEIPVEGGTSVPYFVMELVHGTSLAQVLRVEKRLPARRVVPIAVQCARGLAAAHAAGVIHRDLKPDNVFLTASADGDIVKLLDFGVARVAGASRLTRAGIVFGTPHYMSPEQANGSDVDARSDIYSLGIILYECFTGRVPFEADSFMGVLTKHVYVVPDPIEEAAPDRASLGALGPIVMRCLAKEPNDRFANASDLASALELAASDPSEAARAMQPSDRPAGMRLRDVERYDGRMNLPAGRSASPSRIAWAVAGGCLVAAALVAGWTLRGRVAMDSPRASPLRAAASTTPSAAPAPPPAVSAPGASASPEPPPSAEPAHTAEPVPPHRPSAPPVGHRSPAPAQAAPPPSPPRAKRSGDVVDPWSK